MNKSDKIVLRGGLVIVALLLIPLLVIAIYGGWSLMFDVLRGTV